MQGFHLARAHTQFLGYFDGIHANALQVVMGSVVLGLDRQSQSLDGAEVKGGHFLDVALFVLQLPKVETIRAVNEVDDGNDQQRSFPSELAVEPANHAGKGCAHEVIGK